jgi:hypothetical protein
MEQLNRVRQECRILVLIVEVYAANKRLMGLLTDQDFEYSASNRIFRAYEASVTVIQSVIELNTKFHVVGFIIV